MSIYLSRCDKCTRYYFKKTEKGAWKAEDGPEDRWCQIAIDTGVIPIQVDGESGKDFVIHCDHYSTDPDLRKPYPDKEVPLFHFADKHGVDNEERYARGDDRFHCVGCGREVVLDESYSNRGKNMVCWRCYHLKARDLGIEPFDFLKKYVWEDDQMDGNDAKEILQALRDLGYTLDDGGGKGFTFRSAGYHRCVVYVEDQLIGIWDCDRKTFVD